MGAAFLLMVSQDFRQIRKPRIASVTEICREVGRANGREFIVLIGVALLIGGYFTTSGGHEAKADQLIALIEDCIRSDVSANLCKICGVLQSGAHALAGGRNFLDLQWPLLN